MGKFRDNEGRSPRTVPVSKLTKKVPTSVESLKALAKDIDDSYADRPAHWPDKEKSE